MTGVISVEGFSARLVSPQNASLIRLARRSICSDPKRSFAVAMLAGGPIGLLVTFQFGALVRPQRYFLWSTPQLEALLGSMLPLVVAVVVVASFAVSVRRRARELGQLVVVGAERSHVRRLVMFEAAALLLAGAVVVSVVASFAMLVYRGDLTPRLVDRPWWSLTATVVAPLLVGLGVGLIAALLPALHAASASPLVALGDRITEQKTRRWPLAVALVMVGALLLVRDQESWWRTGETWLWGVAMVWAGFAVVAATVPLVLERVARLADRLPRVGRLALRDIGRSTMRASALTVVASALTGIGIMAAAGFESDDGVYEEMDPRFVIADPRDAARADDAVAELGTIRATATLDVIRPIESPFIPHGPHQVAALTDETIEFFELSDAVVASVPPGGAIMLNGQDWPMFTIDGDRIEVVATNAGGGSIPWQTVPIALMNPADLEQVPRYLDEEAAHAWDHHLPEGMRVYALYEPLTAQQIDDVRSAHNSGAPMLGTVSGRNFGPFGLGPQAVRRLVLGVVFGIVVLAAVGLTKLGATEADAQLKPMVALGARPSIRRRFFAVQTGTLVCIGGLLGSGLGVTLFWVVTRGDPSVPDVIVPWSAIATFSLGAAVISAGAVAMLFGPKPLRTEQSGA